MITTAELSKWISSDRQHGVNISSGVLNDIVSEVIALRADLVQAKDAARDVLAERAREARDEQMRAEGRVAGLREAAEIAGLNAWKHAGEDDYSRGMDAGAAHQVRACCDAIRAAADKIGGKMVKAGGHNRECGE